MGLQMANLDWVFLGILAFSLCVGAWRGFVFEALSLMGWVAAFFLAQWFAQDIAAYLPLAGWAPSLQYAAGFVAVFVVAIFVAGFLAWLLGKLVQAMGLRPVDRVLGALFGVLRGGVLLVVVAVVAGMTSINQADWWRNSQGAPWVDQAVQGLKRVAPPEWGRYLPS